MIRVIICDDHEVVRVGIRKTLESEVDLRVVAEAANYQELRLRLRENECDVLLLDISLSGRNGLEVLSALQADEKKVSTLIVSMHPEDRYALRCLRAGALGYINKASSPQLIIDAVRSIGQGRRFVTPEIAEILVNGLTSPDGSEPHEALADRELETLKLIAKGKKLNDIANELMISPKTVSVYRRRILDKLKLSTTSQLILYAIENRLNH